MKTPKTNAARILDRAGVAYRLATYAVDENDLSAGHLAAQLGLDVNTVFKTLALKGDRTGHLVCVIPGGAELDLKKVARASGNKSCAMIAMKDLRAVTGYVRGGCSPLGMKKELPTFVHESAARESAIHISAGQRGLQIILDPADLVRVTGAVAADLTVG